MLPITHQRVFHIPHSLATLAAIAAVITALGWDRAEPDPTQADASTERAVIAANAEPQPSEAASNASSGGSVSAGNGLTDLLPLVLPGSPKR